MVATLLAYGYWRCVRRAAPLALNNPVKVTEDLGIQVERQDFEGLTVLGLESECRRMGLRINGDQHTVFNRVKDEAARREGLVGTPEDRHRVRMQEARRVHGISSGSAAAGPRVLSPEQVEYERLVLEEIAGGAVSIDLFASYNGPDPRRKLFGAEGGPWFFRDVF